MLQNINPIFESELGEISLLVVKNIPCFSPAVNTNLLTSAERNSNILILI
jgi:hypothetical protein